MASSLAAERSAAAVNQALLAFSRTVAELHTDQDIAEAVTTVVPVVTGAERASVLSWDPEQRALRTLAAVGFGDDTAERLELRTTLGSTPVLKGMLAAPGPVELVRGEVDPFLDGVLARFGSTRATVAPLRDDGQLLGVVVASTATDASVEPEALLAVADQTAVAIARRRLLSAAVHAATHDPLTGIPGRELLGDRLERALADHRRTGRRVAVCFLDLDGFKGVNDTHGHAAGDRVLVAVAERLRGVVRESDTIARVSGDEFVVLLRELTEVEDVHRSAGALVAAVESPLHLDGVEATGLSGSVGVAVAPEDGVTPDALLRAADATMYGVKRRGGAGYALAAE